MKHYKLMMASLLLAIGGGSAVAQTDVTSDYLLNPSFELSAKDTPLAAPVKKADGNVDIYGWTLTGVNTSTANSEIVNKDIDNSSNYGTKVDPADGKYYLFARNGWAQNSQIKLTSDEISLPKGDYKLSVKYKQLYGYDKDAQKNSNTKTSIAFVSSSSEIVSKTSDPAKGIKGNNKTNDFVNMAWSTLETEVFHISATKTGKLVIKLNVGSPKRSDFLIDDVHIYKVSRASALKVVIDNAQEIIPTANVGNSVLQISKEEVEKLKNAISTAEALVNKTDATEEELDNGIKALNTAVETYKNTELNKPGENDKFNIIISGNSGYKHNDKTLTFKANNGPGGYAMGYTEDKGVFYNQAVTLTYAGNKDLYYLSINEDNGKIIYVGLGTNYDGNNLQIRAIDSKEKALKIQIQATSTDGLYNILNTVTKTYISANSADDTGFYTANSKYKNFKIIPAIKNTATIDITDAKWATFIAPFDATLPEGVKAYTCDANEGTTLTLTEATELKANTPYILYSENIVNQSVEGYALANKESYNGGYLTGVYTEATVEKGNYVLQNQDENGVAFYLVDSDKFKSGANKAYMTIPASAGAKSFTLDTTATALNKLLGNTGAVEVERFNAAGAKVEAPVKGLNIIKMSDGSIVKVIIK